MSATKKIRLLSITKDKKYMSIENKDVVRILYLYDYKGWAIYNVGKLWLSSIPEIKVTYKKSSSFKISDFDLYDLIWFGYLDLFIECYCKFYINKDKFYKCIVAVHDPLELFPQQKDWKNVNIKNLKLIHTSSWLRKAKYKILKQVKFVITISKEMQFVLQKMGIESFLIPTTSSLPLKNRYELKTEKCNILSVFEIYPRKNISLMESIQKFCTDSLKVKYHMKIGKKILPIDQYIQLLDDHEIYICTSFQEGGPIPAIDAMQRGSVVLTTPVGQIQEIIEHGQNGYICNSKQDFINKIMLLTNNPKLLHRMRIKSLETVNNRNVEKIKSLARFTTDNILRISISSVQNKRKHVSYYASWLYGSLFYKFSYKIAQISDLNNKLYHIISSIIIRFRLKIAGKTKRNYKNYEDTTITSKRY